MSRRDGRKLPVAVGWAMGALVALSWHGSAAAPSTGGAKRVSSARALTTAPGIEVRSLSPHRTLAGKRIEEFDISPQGSVVVRIGGTLYDFVSGARLTSPKRPVRSFAFVQGALAVVTDGDRLGFWKEGGVSDAGKVPRGARRLRSSESGHQLLLIGDTPDSGVFRFSSGAGIRPLCGAPTRGVVAAGEGERCLVAVGGSLFDVDAPGSLTLRMALPPGKGEIVGLALAGDATYFATPVAVSSLQGGLAFPLAVGIGGPLRMTVRGLLLLDRKTGSLYRLSGAGLTGSGQAVAARVKSRAPAGTLKINLAYADPKQCAPWYGIYVDGKLLYRYKRDVSAPWKNPRRFQLPAGRHRVEAAVKLESGSGDISFPFKFRAAEVFVPTGGVASVTLEVQTCHVDAFAFSAYPETEAMRPWFDRWARSIEETRRRAAEDPVAAALLAARRRSGRQGASRSRLWIELPEGYYGGAREYDAEQVQLVVAWLQRYHWAWAAPIPDEILARMTEEMRQEYHLLRETIAREKSHLAKLGEVASRMK